MTRASVASCLYPDEAEIARLVLGKQAPQWPAIAILLERHGLPKPDALTGRRYWPAVRAFLDRRSSGEMAFVASGDEEDFSWTNAKTSRRSRQAA